MQLAPGRSPCDIQFGGQSLFGRRHQMRRPRIFAWRSTYACAACHRGAFNQPLDIQRTNPGGEARAKLVEFDAMPLQLAVFRLRQIVA